MPNTRSTKHIGASSISSAPSQTSHFQDGPRFGNHYTEDFFLQATIKRLISDQKLLSKCEAELTHLGDRAAYEMAPHAKALNVPENQPRLVHYNAWGKRVDEIQTHPSWRYMHGVAAEEGIVADGYDVAKWGQDCRLVQFSKLFVFNPSSGLYSCPLAMTDGAVRYLKFALNENVAPVEQKLVELNIGDTFAKDPALTAEARRLLSHLLSRQGDQFYTSGQWMTERGGGSDVAGGTETIARKQPDGSYLLYGYKWFTSATDANIALTLARIESADGTVLEGTSGLSCFLVNVRDPVTKELNNIRVHRLKNKLGTKQLPTAEMELVGTKATLVSVPGRGIPAITTGMVNVTRLYNSISSGCAIRKVTALARDYCHRRSVFGSKLSENRLHLRTLAALELNNRACLASTLDAVSMLGRVETSKSEDELLGGPSIAGSVLKVSEANELVRLLTPVLKAWTAKVAVACVSEGLETFGGQGYMEDSNIPSALRDAQVLPIWEGTTNVLSMDTLRVLAKSKFQAFFVLERLITERCAAASSNPSLKAAADSILAALEKISEFLKSNFGTPNLIEALARDLCLSLGRVNAGSCLIEHAVWSRDVVDVVAAKRFCCEWSLVTGLDVPSNVSGAIDLDRALALDLDPSGNPRGFGDYEANGKARARL